MSKKTRQQRLLQQVLQFISICDLQATHLTKKWQTRHIEPHYHKLIFGPIHGTNQHMKVQQILELVNSIAAENSVKYISGNKDRRQAGQDG